MVGKVGSLEARGVLPGALLIGSGFSRGGVCPGSPLTALTLTRAIAL